MDNTSPILPSGTQPENATDHILENLLDAVLVVDASGRIIYANRSALRLFEKEQAHLLGQPFGFPVVPLEVQEIEVIKGGVVLTVQVLAAPIAWGSGQATLLSLRDISAQKKLMEELEAQKGLLERKSEENAQYASMASHDLKEPVRKILLYSDLLLQQEHWSLEEGVKLKRIHAAAARMKQLIQGIADLSRVGYVEQVFAPVALKGILEEVCEDLELQIAEKAAQVEIHPMPVVEAIPGKIYQLFLNLISNSLKYARKEVPPRVRILCAEDGPEHVVIRLEDNGIGFKNAQAAQLFQPFKRLHKSAYEGVGIGLSLCKRIVELHGGTIRAEGVEGKGATFMIRLPLRQRS